MTSKIRVRQQKTECFFVATILHLIIVCMVSISLLRNVSPNCSEDGISRMNMLRSHLFSKQGEGRHVSIQKRGIVRLTLCYFQWWNSSLVHYNPVNLRCVPFSQPHLQNKKWRCKRAFNISCIFSVFPVISLGMNFVSSCIQQIHHTEGTFRKVHEPIFNNIHKYNQANMSVLTFLPTIVPINQIMP